MFQSIDICTVLAPRVLLEIGPLALSGLCCTFLSIQEQHAHLFRHPSEYAAENRHLAHLISISSWRLQYRYNTIWREETGKGRGGARQRMRVDGCRG